MVSELLSIFLNVVVPVFTLVLLGYLLGPRLKLQYRTLSRTAYFLLIPAFVFHVLSTVKIDLDTAGRMVAGISLIYIATGLIGWSVARIMRYDREMAVAWR